MEGLVVLVVIVIGVALGVRSLRYWSRQRTWNRAYVGVGKRYNGKVPNSGVTYGFMFSKPSLGFNYRGCHCLLRCKRSSVLDSSEVTILRMQGVDHLFNFEITTGEFKDRKNIGSTRRQARFEDPQLDAVFNAAAKEVHKLETLLNHSSVCWQLEQLRRHTGSNQLYIRCRGGTLEIAKPGFLVDYQQLDDFVRYALQLYDQFLLAQARGISFVNDDTAAVVDDVKCPICSEEIVVEMVVCTRCKTPHCRDCWQYNGQCATFACSETRYLQVGSVESSSES